MKLRNKKTGEIKEVQPITIGGFRSLAELNDEWEDYEEPEMFYIVEHRGMVGSRFRTGDEYEKMFKEIGNYFETKEEAEKAVEKLKAWKRLKDKGFRFEGWDNTDRSTIHNFSLFVAIEDLENINKDLDLLFSQEGD